MESKAWLRRFWVQLLAGSVAFLLGLGASAWGLRAVASRYAPPGGDKFAYLVEHAAEYDVVVIGSSIVAVDFRAQPFEERLRDEHGRRLRAYSFAMGRLTGAELDFYVHRILALPMPKLEWLLIDVTLDQKPEMLEKNWYSKRELDWQTPRQFAIVGSQIMARNEPLSARLQTLWPYARHLAINVLAIGRGLPALEGFDRRNEFRDRSLWSSEDTGDERVPIKEAKAARYRERPDEHEAAVRKLAARRRPSKSRNNELSATWRDAAMEQGVQVAYIVGPSMRPSAFPAKVKGEPDLRIFDFNDPKKHPLLYKLSYHYDPWHMTEPGARVFSQGLADELDAAMDEVEQR